MAASDKTYRSQKTLDIVFAVTGILMLLSIVGMFAQDYFREFKTEQRSFRDVETAMAERAVLELLPQGQIEALRTAEKELPKEDAKDLADRRKDLYAARKKLLEAEDQLTQTKQQADLDRERNGNDHKDEVDKARQDVETTRKQRDDILKEGSDNVQAVLKAENDLLDYLDRFRNARKAVRDAQARAKEERDKSEAQVRRAGVAVAQADASYRSAKAIYDSKESLYNIARDESDHSSSDQQNGQKAHLQALRDELNTLRQNRDAGKDKLDAAKDDLHKAETDKALAEALQTQAEAKVKQLQADVDRYQKLVKQKQWKADDWLRSQPVIDAFASPYRIQQYTLNEYPIDYSFKFVTRFDRCTTCHLGMEKGSYDKKALSNLTETPRTLQENLARFRGILQDRKNRGEDVPPDRAKGESGGFDLDELPTQVATLPKNQLTDARVTQFCAHPRLDLFVDSNSPHPADKFGCTSCHSGQGSGTDFRFAAHTPDNPEKKEQWTRDYGWFPSEFWDFPMYAKRFKESACLKCHHEVTDLVRYGNQVEAPTLVRGFNLVRDNGCFGCHEIAGTKRGREIGPDLRLEPSIPLHKMDPVDRAKAEADRDNPPGTMRKVGPSLFRLSEKTYEDWVARWLWSPRGFRPSTRMPHFYGVSNNSEEGLKNTKEYGTDQTDFPAAEVRAVAHYLMFESQKYLDGEDAYRRTNRAVVKFYQDRQKKQGVLSEGETKEMTAAEERLEPAAAPLLELRLGRNEKPRHVADLIIDGEGKPVHLPDLPKDDDGRKKEQEHGRRLFTEKGCLACHYNEWTTKIGTPAVPAVVSEAEFGPDLSHVAAKLGTKAGDEASARRWLVQWILNPQAHHPRTRMPYTHLNAEDAAAVAAWLLSQGKDWKGEVVPDVADAVKTYKQLAQLYLSKVRNPDEVRAILQLEDEKDRNNPQDQERLRQARERASIWLDGIRPDSDEAILQGGINEEKLQLYVGRKAISRYGCFGCHNLPGFETSKPIGTPLNDWGKKDPERLAFEDIVAYVQDHHKVVERRDDEKDPSKPSKEWSEVKDGKTPYEKFFAEELHHHQRDGFLNQKLREPRSYDYHRQRVWDDRLRMPQFKFSHSRKREEESGEEYELRRDKEEAEAREAVMTFILGLVAEPVPAEYLNRPNPDRLAEARGRKLVEQFNCVGCHEVRPGLYEFSTKAPKALERLEKSYQAAVGNFAADFGSGQDPLHAFLTDNAWKGAAPPWPDRLQAQGINFRKAEVEDGEGEEPIIRLTEAVHFVNRDGKPRDLPADSTARLPNEFITVTAPLGGAFTHLLIPYLNKKDSLLFKLDSAGDSDNARSVLPPQLFREGQRTQPEWLFEFIRNPTVIRPQERMLLRMPKFNLSDDEVRTLVNYFNAINKVNNPGVGLTYPYVSLPEREEDYWRDRTREYKARLGKDKVEQRAREFQGLWEKALKDQLAEAELKLATAEDLIKTSKEADARKAAEQQRDALKKDVETFRQRLEKKDVTELRRQWEDTGVYLADGYRLLVNSNSPCLGCHAVGSVPSKEAKGPNLDLSYDRLRPGWTEHWLANPARLMQPTIMPANFPRDKRQYNEVFDGTSVEQVQAVRDVLMNFPKVANRPENHFYRPGSGGGN
jgi:cytochrome c2